MARSSASLKPSARAAELLAKIDKAKKELNSTKSEISTLIQAHIDECGSIEGLPLRPDAAHDMTEKHGSAVKSRQNDDTDNIGDCIVLRAADHVAKIKKMLTEYNELKDTAHAMLGLLADRQGRTMRAMLQEKGIEDGE